MKLEHTRYMQYVAAVTGTLVIGSATLYITWPSPTLPKIAAGDSPLGNVTQEETSWMVSSLLLGYIPGSVLSKWTIETFGRRSTLLISGVPILFLWYIIAFANSIWILCFARFIAGMAIQISINGILMYNGEIAEKEIRGRLSTTFAMVGTIGEIIPLCIGPYISYKALALISSALPLVFLLLFYFMPESPYYLVKVNKEDEAKRSLKRLLSNDISDDSFEEKMLVIKSTVEEEMVNKSTLLELISRKKYRKSLIVSLGLNTLVQLSGIYAILAYMQTILEHNKSTISGKFFSAICGLIQIPSVFLAAALVDRAGRKPLLIISALGCAVALSTIGIYFYLEAIGYADISYLSWMPFAGIVMFMAIRPVGLGSLVYVMMGELFATNIKEHAVAVSMFYKSILAFCVLKSFKPISGTWGHHVVFGFYAVICIIGSAFVYFIVPETKNRTFSEIREKLNRRNRKNRGAGL